MLQRLAFVTKASQYQASIYSCIFLCSCFNLWGYMLRFGLGCRFPRTKCYFRYVHNCLCLKDDWAGPLSITLFMEMTSTFPHQYCELQNETNLTQNMLLLLLFGFLRCYFDFDQLTQYTIRKYNTQQVT